MHLSPDYGGTGAAHHRTTAAVALSFSDRLYWGPCLFIHDIKEGSSASVDLGQPSTLDNCWFLVLEGSLSSYRNKCWRCQGCDLSECLGMGGHAKPIRAESRKQLEILTDWGKKHYGISPVWMTGLRDAKWSARILLIPHTGAGGKGKSQ